MINILCRGCFNLGLIAPAILPLASLTNALVSDCQAYLSVPVPMTCQARIGCPHRLLIYCYVSVMKAAAQQVALFIVSQIRKGGRNEAGRARYSSNQEGVKKNGCEGRDVENIVGKMIDKREGCGGMRRL